MLVSQKLPAPWIRHKYDVDEKRVYVGEWANDKNGSGIEFFNNGERAYDDSGTATDHMALGSDTSDGTLLYEASGLPDFGTIVEEYAANGNMLYDGEWRGVKRNGEFRKMAGCAMKASGRMASAKVRAEIEDDGVTVRHDGHGSEGYDEVETQESFS